MLAGLLPLAAILAVSPSRGRHKRASVATLLRLGDRALALWEHPAGHQ